MSARHATAPPIDTREAAGFDHRRVVAAFDRAVAAAVEPGCVRVLGLPGLHAIAELGIEGGAETADAAFLDHGALAVLSRSNDRARLYVVDPIGPRKLGELTLGGTARIVAVSRSFLLVANATGAITSLIDASRSTLAAPALPIRNPIIAAGSLGPGRFLVASGSTLEEWDGETRMPVRRLRIDRPLHVEHLGGNAQRIWIISRNASNVLEVVSIANRSTTRIELTEPVARVVAHPGGDRLVAIGADSRTVYVVDVGHARPPVRLDCGPVRDIAWLDHGALVIAPVDGPVATIAVPSAHPRPSLVATDEAPLARPAAPCSSASDPIVADTQPTVPLHETTPVQRPPLALARSSGPSAVSRASSCEGGWRAELVAWARGGQPAFAHAATADLAARLDRATEAARTGDRLRPAIELLYAARLLGTDGVAPIELAAVLGWRWKEVLGGDLGGLVRRRRGRCHLIEEVIAALDEQAPRRGEIFAGDSGPTEPVAIVAPADLDLRAVAAWAAPIVGALLVPDARGERAPSRFLLEARARGLTPLLPWTRWADQVPRPLPVAAVLVHAAETASELALPVIGSLQPGPLDRHAEQESGCTQGRLV